MVFGGEAYRRTDIDSPSRVYFLSYSILLFFLQGMRSNVDFNALPKSAPPFSSSEMTCTKRVFCKLGIKETFIAK